MERTALMNKIKKYYYFVTLLFSDSSSPKNLGVLCLTVKTAKQDRAVMWTGAKHNLLKIPGDGPSLMLDGAHIKSSNIIRLLAVLLTPNLSMNKHITSLSAKCFFHLRQLRHIRRSLDNDSVATLVQAFIANRVDYCVDLLAGSPKKTIAKLQRVLNTAARVVSNCGKYDRGLTHFRCYVLHWLDVTDRIRFRLCIQL